MFAMLKVYESLGVFNEGVVCERILATSHVVAIGADDDSDAVHAVVDLKCFGADE